MKKDRKLIGFVLVMVLGMILPATADKDIKWSSSYEKALKKAERLGKNVLLHFYAKDSERLPALFKNGKVKSFLSDMGGAKINGSENKELARRYGISAYPTYIFLTSKGEEITRIAGETKTSDFLKVANRVREVPLSPDEMAAEFKNGSGDVNLLYYLAQYYSSKKQREESIEALKRIVETDPTNKEGRTADASFLISYNLIGLKRIGEAKKQLKSYLETYPDHSKKEEAYYLLVITDLDGDDVAAAKEKLKQIARIDINSSSLMAGIRYLSQNYYTKLKNDNEGAVNALEWFVKEFPNARSAPAVQHDIGNYYLLGLKKPDAAASAYLKVIEMAPESKLARISMRKVIGIEMSNEQYERLIRSIEALHKKNQSLRPNTDLIIGKTYINMKEYGKAADVYNQVVKNFPKSPLAGKALKELGDIYMTLNVDYDKAISSYETIIKKYKDTKYVFDAEYGLGNCYYFKKNFKEAKNHFRKSYKGSEGYPKVAKLIIAEIDADGDFDGKPRDMYVDAINLDAVKKHDEAKKLYERILNDYPQCNLRDNVHYALGNEYAFILGSQELARAGEKDKEGDKEATIGLVKQAVKDLETAVAHFGMVKKGHKLQQAIAQRKKINVLLNGARKKLEKLESGK